MGNPDYHTTLFRIDASRNMARFYSTTIQPNLFGGQSLVRNWGRIGSAGQLRIDFFDSETDAIEARDQLVVSKSKRGYAREKRPVLVGILNGFGRT